MFGTKSYKHWIDCYVCIIMFCLEDILPHTHVQSCFVESAYLHQLTSPACIQIAFHPKFLASRVEKERRAILSELQMMNTIDYRVDCQVWTESAFVF